MKQSFASAARLRGGGPSRQQPGSRGQDSELSLGRLSSLEQSPAFLGRRDQGGQARQITDAAREAAETNRRTAAAVGEVEAPRCGLWSRAGRWAEPRHHGRIPDPQGGLDPAAASTGSLSEGMADGPGVGITFSDARGVCRATGRFVHALPQALWPQSAGSVVLRAGCARCPHRHRRGR